MKKKGLIVLTGILSLGLLLQGCGSQEKKGASENKSTSESKTQDNAKKEEPKSNTAEKSTGADPYSIKASDGQPIIIKDATLKKIPKKEGDPKSYPEDDSRRWYDLEYAGWNIEKINIPKSPKTGAKGKKVTYISWGEHPYFTAVENGIKKVAEAYGMELKTMRGDWTPETQAKQAEAAIKEKPDMIVILPADANKCLDYIKKINAAGIPVICHNLIPSDEAQKYILSWAGPDDWQAQRNLADKFAEMMNKEGGYAIVQHAPGSSAETTRKYAYTTQLKKVAPNMKLLDAQTGKLNKDETQKLVEGWIEKYGKDLKGIIIADDLKEAEGAIAAVKKLNRPDIIMVASGNSKQGMERMKAGELKALSYQSAEADGGTAIKVAADWFNGEEIQPIVYNPLTLSITKENMDKFLPAQWGE